MLYNHDVTFLPATYTRNFDLGVQLKPREILPINACSQYMNILKSTHVKENTQNGVGINCCIEEQTQFTVNRTAL